MNSVPINLQQNMIYLGLPLGDDQFIYEELEIPYQNRKLETIQMMNEEALEAFKLWSENINKIEY